MNDHTPGPWRVQADPQHRGKHPLHECRFVTTDHEFETGTDRDGNPVIGFERGPAEIICKTTDSHSQAANARLIAAAPDLLDACKRLLKLMPDLTRCVKNNAIDDYQELNEAPIAAANAIAKATSIRSLAQPG